MNAPLPGPLADNPILDRWVSFPSPGKVGIGTGRVELGQGVLTAMAQIAAALDDNICRCGSHNRIIRAVQKAAAQMRAGAPL